MNVSVHGFTLLLAFLICLSDGKVARRIIGGSSTLITDFPHQVSLRKNELHYCGGSIISHLHIITAAQCVVSESGTVFSNIKVLSGIDYQNGSGGQIHEIEMITYYDDFEDVDFENRWLHDIAVIQLTEPIVFSHSRKSVVLLNYYVPTNSTATIAGWGDRNFTSSKNNSDSVDILQKLETRVIHNQECQFRYDDFYGSDKYQIYAQQICTLGGIGKGACLGDAGNPLIYEGQLIGIQSRVTPCARGIPDIYTRVYPQYVHWVNKVINGTIMKNSYRYKKQDSILTEANTADSAEVVDSNSTQKHVSSSSQKNDSSSMQKFDFSSNQSYSLSTTQTFHLSSNQTYFNSIKKHNSTSTWEKELNSTETHSSNYTECHNSSFTEKNGFSVKLTNFLNLTENHNSNSAEENKLNSTETHSSNYTEYHNSNFIEKNESSLKKTNFSNLTENDHLNSFGKKHLNADQTHFLSSTENRK